MTQIFFQKRRLEVVTDIRVLKGLSDDFGEIATQIKSKFGEGLADGGVSRRAHAALAMRNASRSVCGPSKKILVLITWWIFRFKLSCNFAEVNRRVP